MTTEVSARVVLKDHLHFQGLNKAGRTIDLDTTSAEHSAGMTPMELILIGLASCSGMDVAAILRKKRQPFGGLEVRIRGQRRDEHPTVYTAIELEYIVRGEDINPQAVAQAIELSKSRYCPVWAMLEPGVEITSSYRIVSAQPVLAPVD